MKAIDYDYSDERDEMLRDPIRAATYLRSFLDAGNVENFHEALRTVAKAQSGGLKAVAENAGVTREGLYNARDPRISTASKLLDSMGLKLSVVPKDATVAHRASVRLSDGVQLASYGAPNSGRVSEIKRNASDGQFVESVRHGAAAVMTTKPAKSEKSITSTPKSTTWKIKGR